MFFRHALSPYKLNLLVVICAFVGFEPHITDFYSSTLSRAADFRLVNPDCTGRLQSPIYCDKPAFIVFSDGLEPPVYTISAYRFNLLIYEKISCNSQDSNLLTQPIRQFLRDEIYSFATLLLHLERRTRFERVCLVLQTSG